MFDILIKDAEVFKVISQFEKIKMEISTKSVGMTRTAITFTWF